MARRSTRLSSRNSSTPKRVSLSHDAPPRTPKTAPVKLGTLTENDEMPGAFPQSASPPERAFPSAASKPLVKVPVHFNDATPKHATPPKPSSDEMHPVQHYQSTAKPLDEARWLGFATMAPHTEPAKQGSRIATLQGTPTRTSKAQSEMSSPQYQFTFQREHSLELSPEAKKLMFEKREEAVRIRQQMMTTDEDRESIEAAVSRKLATPKGKAGRFSDAHQEHFQKMDSIAGHASAFRANSTWKKPSPAQQAALDKTSQPAAKSLKRSPSKAQLDEPERAPAPSLNCSPAKHTVSSAGSGLPRATSSKDLCQGAESQSSAPAKRVKRFQGEDATITRPTAGWSDGRQPATPSPVKYQPSYPDLKSLASPNQATLARATSVKSTKSSKIPALPLARSPSKAKLVDHHDDTLGPSTPLLARSPAKGGLFANATNGGSAAEEPKMIMGALLGRSPAKGSLFSKKKDSIEKEEKNKESPLLSRSPTKMPANLNSGGASKAGTDAQFSKKEPLLSRSPMKMSVNKHADAVGDAEEQNGQKISQSALSSRSPMKMSVTRLPDATSSAQGHPSAAPTTLSTTTAERSGSNTAAVSEETPTKPSNKSLLDRFSFLRSSPVKSILRSPHRLYSDDPAKVAAGTHLATPPKKTASQMNKKLAAVSKTVPSRKHVDFTSSTKARYERVQSETTSTPSKESSLEPETASQAPEAPTAAVVQYPSLPMEESSLTITPQKRRQTIAPGDFTFRAGPDGIVFGTSPNAPASTADKKRVSTIRHVSAEPTLPATTTKKRKFEFENHVAAHQDTRPIAPAMTTKKRKYEFENDLQAAESTASDKENGSEEAEADERPAKRVKPSASSPEKKARRPTLGVRPKDEVKGVRSASGSTGTLAKSSASAAKERKPATISQARLAALAQPKRRC